jgi:hypothetical protein
MRETELLREIAAALSEHGHRLNRTYVYLSERAATDLDRRVAHRIQLARDACWQASVEVADCAPEVHP